MSGVAALPPAPPSWLAGTSWERCPGLGPGPGAWLCQGGVRPSEHLMSPPLLPEDKPHEVGLRSVSSILPSVPAAGTVQGVWF